MNIISAPTHNLPKITAGIGFFDGVHFGHRSLINAIKEQAKANNTASGVVTFKTHPRAVLSNDYRPQLLNTYKERMTLLAEECGVDYIIALDFDYAMSKMSSKEFMEFLHDKFNISALYVGYDHKFGHNRSDGFDEYVQYGKEIGMEVFKAEAKVIGSTPISSSAIRRFLNEGDVDNANSMLSYNYSISGRVVKGFGLGRTIGFKTANIEVESLEKLIPANGVYAVKIKTPDNVMRIGMLNIGNRPTVHENIERSIEVNIFDFDGELYDSEIEIYFVKFMRSERKMESVEELQFQLSKDKEEALNILTR